MPTDPKNVFGSLLEIWKRFAGRLVGNVPADIALCEFDCRKEQCRYDEWSSCERRISKAAGELMPADSNVTARRKP